jgi:hypothetical protein
MQRERYFGSTLCLVLLCSAIFLDSSTLAAAQESILDGTYMLDRTDSDNVNEVIEDTIRNLNFVTREIARDRLKKLNPAYHQVIITSSPNEISVTVDNQPPLRTPATGTPVAWVSPDGRKVNASMQLADRRLAQTFTSADGRRVNDYTLSPDGRTLTMQVTETSARLSQPIAYKQIYRRGLMKQHADASVDSKDSIRALSSLWPRCRSKLAVEEAYYA